MHQATQPTHPLVFAIGRITLLARLGVIITFRKNIIPPAEQRTEEGHLLSVGRNLVYNSHAAERKISLAFLIILVRAIAFVQM